MNKLNKLLKITFFILLFVIISEAGYYVFSLFYIQNNKLSGFSQTNKTNQSLTKLPKHISESDLVINRDILQDFYIYTKDTLISSLAVNKFAGKIIELNRTPGKTPQGFEYKLELIIQGNKTKKGFLYNDYDLKIMKLSRGVDKKNQKINLDDLKKGDKIIIIETLDLTKKCAQDECIQEIEIIKLN